MRESRQSLQGLEFETCRDAGSPEKSQNELIQLVYTEIIENLSRLSNSAGNSASSETGLKRIQSMLFSLSQSYFKLSDKKIQQKLGVFYAYTQRQIQVAIERHEFNHLEEFGCHFEQLLDTIDLCPIESPLRIH